MDSLQAAFRAAQRLPTRRPSSRAPLQVLSSRAGGSMRKAGSDVTPMRPVAGSKGGLAGQLE
eukprot:12406311-Karenia_brevis.AAC.1